MGLGVGARGAGVAKVLHRLARVLPGAEEHTVGALRLAHGELIESQALTTSSKDARAGALSEAKGAHLEGGEIADADIIGDRGDDDSDLVLLVLHVLCEARDRHRGSVRLAQVKPAKHNLVELGVSPPGQEPVQLHKKLQVDVLSDCGASRRLWPT